MSKSHAFKEPGPIFKGAPTLRCVNKGCKVLWHADRNQPRNDCEGGEEVFTFTYKVTIFQSKDQGVTWKQCNEFVHHDLNSAVDSYQAAVLHCHETIRAHEEDLHSGTVLHSSDSDTEYMIVSKTDPSQRMLVTVTETKNG